MPMNRFSPYHVKQMILEGEGVSLDFKKTIPSCTKIAKTLVAFANNKGGRLLVGVYDSGEIKGVRNEEEEKYLLTKAAHFYCRPALEPVFEEVYIDNKIVLVVSISESDIKPHYAMAEDNKWWVYVRVKDKSLLASKIIVDVLKGQTSPEGVLIEYSEKEKIVLRYLEEHESIAANDVGKIVKLPRRKAQRLMVNLILSGLVRVYKSEKEEYYTAAS